MKKNQVRIIDCTLREGNQTPGVRLNIYNSTYIAALLNLYSVNMIEIGHPSASIEELQRVKAVVDLKLRCPILSHARANKKDIQAVFEAGAQWVGIIAGINMISQTTRLNRTQVEIFQLVKESIELAKSLGLKVRYTVEDSSRTSITDLLNVYELAVNSGADRICFADTLGVLDPKSTYESIFEIKKRFSTIDVEVHVHDDRGLALANSLSAIDAGATWISTSVNGIGERCGITDTCALIANLVYCKLRDHSCLYKLPDLSNEVQKLTNYYIDAKRPVIGKYAFHHTTELHRKAIEKNSEAYNWIDPRWFNPELMNLPEQ